MTYIISSRLVRVPPNFFHSISVPRASKSWKTLLLCDRLWKNGTKFNTAVVTLLKHYQCDWSHTCFFPSLLYCFGPGKVLSYNLVYTQDIFVHNILIKYNKKDIAIKRHFSYNIFFLCVLKIFIFGQLCLLKPSFKRFLNVTTIFSRKKILLSKCFFIFLWQYCVPKQGITQYHWVPEFPVLNMLSKITTAKFLFWKTTWISRYSVVLCNSQYV